MVNSLISELYEIEGLISCYVYENYDNFAKTNAPDDPIIPVGESISPHSILLSYMERLQHLIMMLQMQLSQKNRVVVD